ncbi:MAG: peptidoglycan DD-metalloendopeptidase family protein [Candidatus Shapirobacteria bacterium]|nr:peptidoglycan DD-metalloendopeptidase family protein [Candidatus Shapirobacteria bacterium]
MDSSAIRLEIENNTKKYTVVSDLIDAFKIVKDIGIQLNPDNGLIISSQKLLSHLDRWGKLRIDDVDGILNALNEIPEDLKDEKIKDLLEETTVKQESVVIDKETLKELQSKQAEEEIKKNEGLVQPETIKNNIDNFIEGQQKIAKEQRDLNTEKVTETKQKEIIQSKDKSGIERLVDQNTKRVETKIKSLGVTAEQASIVVEKIFKQFGPRILEQKLIIEPKKEIAEITKEITKPVVRKKVNAELAEAVYGIDTRIKIENKSESLVENLASHLEDNPSVSQITKNRVRFLKPKIEQTVINAFSGRDLETGEIYTNTFSNEVIRILPELTATELSTVKFEARGVEEEISSLIKGNPGLINTYRGEMFEEVFDNKIIESNPNLTEEQRVVANDLKDFIKPFVNNPIDSFSKEIKVKAGVGGENSAKMERDFEYTKMTVGLVTGQEKVETVIKRFELLNQRAVDVNLHIDGLADVDRLQSFFGEIKTDNNLMGYFNKAQGWTNFIQKADKFTGGFVTKIFPKLGNFLNNGVEGGFRVFAQNTFGLISKNGLGQGLKMAMGNFFGSSMKAGASMAGKALASGAVQSAVSTVAGAATGGIGAAIMGGLSFLKNFLQGNLGDALGSLGKMGLGIATTLLGPALAGALASATAAATAAAGPIIIGVFGFLFIYMIFTSSQVSSLVTPAGMGGGGEEVTSNLDPNTPLPSSCPNGWPVNAPGKDVTQGSDTNCDPNLGSTGSHCRTIKESIDIGVGTGTPVLATHNGVAIRERSSTGGEIIRLHSTCKGKEFYTSYLHLNSINFTGQKEFKAGEVIGESGNTGSNSTGPHLHYQLNELDQINTYLPKDVPRGCLDNCGKL